MLIGFSMPENRGGTTCTAPANVTVASQGTASVTFDWDDAGFGLTEYRVFYVRGGYTSPEYATTNSNFTYSSLAAGLYDFYFYTVCERGESDIIVIEDLVVN